MRSLRRLQIAAALVLLASACGDDAAGPPPPENGEGTVAHDFGQYRGSPETLPQGLFVTGEDGEGVSVAEGFNPFTGVSDLNSDPPDAFEGFGAFTSGDGSWSFGIRERGETDLRNSRLFLEYTNETGQAIVGFDVWYAVEVWAVGERANRIRLKYNTAPSGFGALPDLVSTDNPRGAAEGDAVGTLLDGTLPENRVEVHVRLDLTSPAVPSGTGAAIGALEPGLTGFFRWQYSNTEGDVEGEVRSALAIADITVVPIHGGG